MMLRYRSPHRATHTSRSAVLHALLPAALLVGALMLLDGCKDGCDGVICGPVPPALQLSVTDTVSVDTQLIVLRGSPAVLDTVDTALVVRRTIVDADVMFMTINGKDTIAGTVIPRDASASTYTVAAVHDVPSGSFLVQALRNGRSARTPALVVRTVDGCCGYSVVGTYRLDLPLK